MMGSVLSRGELSAPILGLLLSPMSASAAMSLSSVSVIANSLPCVCGASTFNGASHSSR